MKNLLYIMFVSFCFLQCGKDRVCPDGYTGSNCDKEVKPKRILLDVIEFSSWPQFKNGGSKWDTGTGASSNPDLYFEIYNGANNIYFSQIYNNVTFGETVKDIPFISLESNTLYSLLVFDDDGINGLELMGSVDLPKWLEGDDFPTEQYFIGNEFVVKYTVRYEFK